ncbi:MAG: DUF1538 domain-containing protein [Spirochaetales bacterium]|nr:DUF1538 domain-containing protein [Spirochaetales bacterium]
MELLKRLRGVTFSVLPIIVFVTVFQFLTPLPQGYYPNFLIASAILIIGLTIFLLGVDIALVPAGEQIGGILLKKRCLPLLLIAGFIAGFAITFAEPNAEVLSSQVALANPAINGRIMLLCLSIGVGFTIMLAFLRLVLRIPYRIMMIICYALVFILAILGKSNFVSIGFDAGGTATGPLAVPFIMALGIGSARAKAGSTEADNFGFVSLQTVGAILAVLVMSFVSPSFEGQVPEFSYTSGHFIEGIIVYLKTASISMAPLSAILLFFQIFALHMPFSSFFRIIMGMIYSLIGMTMFLLGANGGFMPVAFEVGRSLASLNPLLLIACAFLLGASVVVAEPSVAVLVEQVEQISSGTIRPRMLLSFMAVGVATALGLVALREILNFSIFWILVPGYILSFILLFIGPDMFGALAFDSGGVSAGPVAAAFMLPFVIGIGSMTGGELFGAIGCISMSPLLTIQIMGLIYRNRGKKGGKKE